MESLGDVIQKKVSKSLFAFKGLCDPDGKFPFDALLIDTWNRLPIVDQRKLYLYLLYRKWRGIDIYGEPYYVIKNCHPVPFNWNGQPGLNQLVKTNRVCIAKYQGTFGTYTFDEARLYQMTEIKQFNN